MMVYKLGFTGSRTWEPAITERMRYNLIWDIVNETQARTGKTIEIHVGDADGIDNLVIGYGINHGFSVFVYGAYNRIRNPHPTYHQAIHKVLPSHAVGKRGYLLRDEVLASAVDEMVAIWNKTSRGTMYTLNHAKKLGKATRLFTLTDDGYDEAVK